MTIFALYNGIIRAIGNTITDARIHSWEYGCIFMCLKQRERFTMFNKMKRLDYGYVCSTEQAIIEKLSREEKHMNAIIYTKPNCQKCRWTVARLSQVMKVQTITADERDYERFRKLGYRSMPVVTVYNIYGTHDEWCDLRVDKIKQYTEERSWK